MREGADHNKPLLVWLCFCAMMVAVMMVIGAVTRLTESGLSMVEWRPLIGVIPPVSTEEWQRIFDLYRRTSEYRLVNAGMAIEEFKAIFWWEYVHRFWGRLIGFAFGAPLVWFWWRGRLEGWLKPHVLALLFLGSLQGMIGWWMVKSGFVDRHDVSQHRLSIHLGMAFLIYGYLLWLIAKLIMDQSTQKMEFWLHFCLNVLCGLIFVTVISGGLVAGLGAGFVYNTWPLIDDSIIPGRLFGGMSIWHSVLEDTLTVQFDHRMLAYLSVVGAIFLGWLGFQRSVSRCQKFVSLGLVISALLQLVLGIATLLSVVEIPIAVLHQAGAIVLFSCGILARHVF